MPDQPAFSVLISAYNHARYVEEALESVALQRWTDWEMVVVDDGSTDDTADRIERWMADFRLRRPNRTVLCRTPNRGQTAGFEHGFGECRGRYIALLDSDDRWVAEKLEEVARAATAAPEAGMIVHPLFVIDPAGVRTGDVRPMRARLSDGDCRDELQRTGRHVAPATTGVVVRADVFRRLVPAPTRRFTYGADAYLTFGATLMSPVKAMNTALGEYRLHEGGQYLRRMSSAEGLTRSLELQRTIAAHFGLEDSLSRNSFFLRNRFALSKLQSPIRGQVTAYAALARATARDGSFARQTRLAMLLYWSACLVAPRGAFERLWTAFQARQTGFRAGLA